MFFTEDSDKRNFCAPFATHKHLKPKMRVFYMFVLS